MARKCPHCGELVRAGQDICFACGQKVHTRARRATAGTNPIVALAAAGIILVGGIGIVIALSGSRKHAAAEAQARELTRVQDSVRQANRARVDTTRAKALDDDLAQATAELNKMEARFTTVQSQVVKDKPSPDQGRIIGQIKSELNRLRQLAATINSVPAEQKPALRDDIRDGERLVRDLISDLSRAVR
jgi:hypothetical protein